MGIEQNLFLSSRETINAYSLAIGIIHSSAESVRYIVHFTKLHCLVYIIGVTFKLYAHP